MGDTVCDDRPRLFLKEFPMRFRVVLILTAAVLFLGSTRARAEEDLQPIIEKGIKAMGGEEKLSKYKAATARTKGTLEVKGLTLDLTQQVTTQVPDQFKEVLEVEIMGQKITATTVFDGKKGWLNITGMETKEAEGAMLEALKEASHMGQVARLTALKDSKTYTLAPLGDAKVEGKEAVGIRVSTKGYRDISLYFDKKTGLLAKIERRAIDPETNQEFTEERLITEYQEKDGLKVAKKVIAKRDGKKMLEVEVVEIKFLESVDKGEFAKP
jgi:hypothetical protein